MSDYTLSQRKKLILQAIIDSHIQNGEPVGSKSLTQNQHLSCSSATIRNEMAELEALGFLEQPHTSAGRVPTEAGYRYYVNTLMQECHSAAYEIEQMSLSLKRKIGEFDQLLTEASRLASSLTNYPGIALKSTAAPLSVSKFDGIYVDEHKFLLVMIFSSGTVRTKTVHPSMPFSEANLSQLLSAFNECLVGKHAAELSLPLIELLEHRVPCEEGLVANMIKTVYDTMKELGETDLRVEGVNRLFSHPEYENIDELRNMISLFENKEDLMQVISPESIGEDDGVRVVIGSENTVKVMNNSALIYRPVKRNGAVVGAIGVIGPRRMDYAKVISTIEGLAQGIDRMFDTPSIPELPEKKGTEQ